MTRYRVRLAYDVYTTRYAGIEVSAGSRGEAHERAMARSKWAGLNWKDGGTEDHTGIRVDDIQALPEPPAPPPEDPVAIAAKNLAESLDEHARTWWGPATSSGPQSVNPPGYSGVLLEQALAEYRRVSPRHREDRRMTTFRRAIYVGDADDLVEVCLKLTQEGVTFEAHPERGGWRIDILGY